ncbi:MAG TPA: FtsX-like permease family protein [Pyrinomonadaceae bacterium]|jgi:lipoprotein-releasing system permease protein|nr:FtsX-like permease family protein [Pyrinomonadaceae bacterium]
MPYELFLALRYLYSRRRRPMARVTALAAILGIAFGVAALVVALALANGFRDEMRDKILRGTAHITVLRRDGQPMTDFRNIIARLRSLDGVSEAAPTTYEGALLSGVNNSAYAVLRGVESESDWTTKELRRTLITGTLDSLLTGPAQAETHDESTQATIHQSAEAAPSSNARTNIQSNTQTDTQTSTRTSVPNIASSVVKPPAITSFDEVPSEAALTSVIIGEELGARTGLNVGDVGQLVSGEGTLTPLGLVPRYRRVRVAGIFRSGLYEYDATWVYLSLANAASFAGQDRAAATAISIEVRDIYDVARVAAEVHLALGPTYTTLDWQEANKPLFAALALERRMGLFIIALIILVAALNITTTLVLVVVERRADIAILSAMGARALSIMSVFMIEGACVGIIGALGGVLLGLFACLLGNRYRLVSLPADVYSISNVPFHAHARDVALAALVAFILSLLATLYPARAAARVRPAEALRDA